MRKAVIARAGALIVLTCMGACTRRTPENGGAEAPTRKAGLWQQAISRDGKAGRLGAIKLCVDAATDARMGVFGRHLAKSECQRSVSRDPSGLYRFSAVCNLNDGAVVRTIGTASGDFGADYRVHSELTISGSPFGPADGVHVLDITGHYLGACPADMKPGDVLLGPGMKVNIDRLPEIASAFGGN